MLSFNEGQIMNDNRDYTVAEELPCILLYILNWSCCQSLFPSASVSLVDRLIDRIDFLQRPS